MTEEKIGTVSVDSGLVIVTDPGGVIGEWEEFVEGLGEKDSVVKDCDGGLVVGGFGGDGVFPVYVKRDEHGMVTELIVCFSEELTEE